MDSDRKRLAAVEREIKDLINQRTTLKKLKRKQILTSDEQEELVRIDMRLAEAKDEKKSYHELIAMKDEPPVSKTYSEADSRWIQSVTGVNIAHKYWTSFVIDETVYPGLEFKTEFESVGKVFHQQNEAGRRIYLNLFLSDIILRREFGGTLRIFPELEVSVTETNGPKKRKLEGKTDYAVGYGKEMDMFDKTIPKEVHLVAVNANTSIGKDDLLQCIAEAAALYKIRVDADKQNKSVWGIVSNAEMWQFIFIDEKGQLWQSEPFYMPLERYDESKVLQVYRMVYYIVECCFKASILSKDSLVDQHIN